MKGYSHRFELAVGYLLMAGVLLTALFLGIGFVWRMLLGTPPQTVYIHTSFIYLWRETLQTLIRGPVRPVTWIDLGIACLLATPYLRVALSVVYFAFAERNLKYVFITLFVFGFLTYSLVAGRPF